MNSRNVRTIVLATIAGLITGCLGIEGTLVLVPGLVYLGIEHEYRMALGTTLAALVLPITLGGAYQYYKRDDVDLNIAALMGVTYLIVAYMSSSASFYFPDNFLQGMASFLYLGLGLFLFYNLLHKRNK